MADQSNMGFRESRILAWLYPQEYASGKAYQTVQALYAIGSGGIFGKGLGNSLQKLGHVPELQNDMIFSIICEELGLFGAISILLMYVLLIWRFMVIASNADDLYGAMLFVGVMTHIAVQVVLNIAVVTNTIPNTGVTLPFISYGGSSVIILLAEIGIVLSVAKGSGKRFSFKSSK
jgi:cell division protein FtsW